MKQSQLKPLMLPGVLRWYGVGALVTVMVPVQAQVMPSTREPFGLPTYPMPRPTPIPTPALFDAINEGDVAAATAALEKDPSQINRLYRNSTPLIAAIRSGKKELVALLLDKGADPNVAGSDRGDEYSPRSTPLQVAVYSLPNYMYPNSSERKDIVERKGIVTMLLDKGAKVDVPDNEGLTPLMHAVKTGNQDAVELLLSKKANVNARDSEGRTPLHIAVKSSRAGYIKLLVEKGADINARDSEGNTPLHTAVLHNWASIKLLVENGADINARTVSGNTPLHLAAAKLSTVMNVLLDAGANAQVANKRGDTPLHVALHAFDTDNDALYIGPTSFLYRHSSGYSERDVRTRPEGLLAALIARSDINAKDQYGQPCLMLALTTRDVEARHDIINRQPRLDKMMKVFDAAAQGDAKTLKKLLDERPFLTSTRLYNGMTPLHISALWGARATTDLLLKKGGDSNARDARAMTPLYRAINRTAVPTRVREIVTLLLAKGAEVNALDYNDNTPLHRALLQPAPDKLLVSMLLDKGADVNMPNRMGQPPLVIAASHTLGKDLVPLLLAKGADANARDRSDTALQRAFGRRDKHTVQMLLDKGADINSLETGGESVLSRLISNSYSGSSSSDTQNKELLFLLLDRGADVNAKSRNGEALLHRAVNYGNRDIITLLLERKADINIKDSFGNTPLMRAIMQAKMEIVTLIVEKGADLTLKNNSEQTALQMAERHSMTAIVDLLRQRGAKE